MALAGATDRVPGTWAVVASLALAVGAAAYVLLFPTYATESTTVALGPDGPGTAVSTRGEATLLEAEGRSALVPVLIPVILSAAALLLNRARYVLPVRVLAAVLLLAFVLVAGFSIGLLYMPSALAMLLAVIWTTGSWRGSGSEGELRRATE